MTSEIHPYEWIPRKGPSRPAVERIRAHVRKPAEPLGEAWFMGESRKMYDELELPNAVKELDVLDLSEILCQISSGTSCFGHLDEWDDWFKYMLPDLIERSGETHYFDTNVLQYVVTAFMSIYWDGLDDHYDFFRDDVMSTLPRTMMHEMFWSDEAEGSRPLFLDVQEDGAGRLKLFWDAGTSNPSVSASLFFCLKYLPAEELPAWIDSVLAIEHPLWQGNLMVWFLGAFDLMKRGTILPDEVDKAAPKLEWENSHVLGSEHTTPEFNDNRRFLPEENVRAFFNAMKAYYTDKKLLDLAEQFSQNEFIATSTFGIPERLQAKLGG